MPGLEIHPFADELLDAAAVLLADRHRRHREAEPLLSEPADVRAEIEALREGEHASGVIGVRDDRVVGFLVGIRKSDEVWGDNVWVDPAGHAVEQAEDVRDLYGAAAERWFEEDRTRHYVVAPATDEPLLEAWHRLSFGHQHALAARELPQQVDPFDGVRLAEPRDLDGIIRIAPLLPDHQDRSPVFGTAKRETEEELRVEIAEDLANPKIANFVVEAGGEIVGNLVIAPTELSSTTHTGLARIEGAALLAYAATRPDVRGSGVGVALTNAGFAWAREQGYETMVTDWRETNLLSSRFWPKRGFRRTFLRLYRSIP
jgi:GNAT superfamily N-acetyltransferase